MEERCSESETFLEKDDGNAVWGKKRGKGISLDRVKEVLLLAYVPLVVVYAVLAFGYYSSSSSLGAPGAGAIDLNLFPCTSFVKIPFHPSVVARKRRCLGGLG